MIKKFGKFEYFVFGLILITVDLFYGEILTKYLTSFKSVIAPITASIIRWTFILGTVDYTLTKIMPLKDQKLSNYYENNIKYLIKKHLDYLTALSLTYALGLLFKN